MSLKNSKDYLYLIWKCPTSRRHYLGCGGENCEKSVPLHHDEEVFLKKESENIYDKTAICVMDQEQRVLGYVPRYYTQAFGRFMDEKRLDKCYISNVEKQTHCDVCVSVTVKIDGKQS